MRNNDYNREYARRRTRRKSMAASIIAVVVIIAAIIAIAVVVISLIPHEPAAPTAQETAAATVQPTLYIPEQQSDAPAAQAETTPAAVAPSVSDTPAPTDADTPVPTVYDIPAPTDAPVTAQPDGTSVEIDGVLHYFASGSTGEGYNWTYSSYGVIVDITCTYRFDTGQYDFIITGTEPGVTSFTLVYYLNDDTPVSVPMTVSVDDDLRVTRIG